MGWVPWPNQADEEQVFVQAHDPQMAQAAQLAQQPIAEPQLQNAYENDEAPTLIPLQQEPQEEVIINPIAAAHLGGPEAMQNQHEHVLWMTSLIQILMWNHLKLLCPFLQLK